MQSDKLFMTLAAAAAMIAAFGLVSSDADAFQDYTRDYGDFYSYTLQFVFDGSDAQSIEWDFGDGTAKSTEWNPRHVYAAKGTYYVTQTTQNTNGETVEIYKVNVLGFPVVSFESNGGSPVASIQMDAYSVPVSRPADPTREGYTFAGWFLDEALEQEFDFGSEVVRTMTLYAKWTAASQPSDPDPPTPTVEEFEVMFDSDGGSYVQTQTVKKGAKAIRPSDPTKNGFRFDGWYRQGALYDFSSPVSSDMTLRASWTQSEPGSAWCIVTFDVDGGSVAVVQQKMTAGSLLVFPAYDGVKEGFEFSGWLCGGYTYQPGQSTAIVTDTVVKVVWQESGSGDGDDGKISFFEDPVGWFKGFVKEPYGIAILIALLILLLLLAYREYSKRRGC